MKDVRRIGPSPMGFRLSSSVFHLPAEGDL